MILDSLSLESFVLYSHKLGPPKAIAPGSQDVGSLGAISVGGLRVRPLGGKGPQPLSFALFSWNPWSCFLLCVAPGDPPYLLQQQSACPRLGNELAPTLGVIAF